MEQLYTRKTYKEKLRPTPSQQRTLRKCCGAAAIFTTRHWSSVSPPGSAIASPYRVMTKKLRSKTFVPNSQSMQPSTFTFSKMCSRGWTRLIWRSSRRIQRGEKAGFPRFKGRARYHSFTFKEYGNGAKLDNGVLVLSKIGRINIHWSRPIEGEPKTITISKEADGWYVAISCAEAPVQPLPSTGQETAIDLGPEAFATCADGNALLLQPITVKPKRICGAANVE